MAAVGLVGMEASRKKWTLRPHRLCQGWEIRSSWVACERQISVHVHVCRSVERPAQTGSRRMAIGSWRAIALAWLASVLASRSGIARLPGSERERF